MKTKTNDCDYQLKAKYEGVFYNKKPLRNSSLTNKIAEDLLKNHKAGKELFEKMGSIKADENVNIKIKDSTIKVLKETYPDLKATKKKEILLELTESGIDINGLIGGEIPDTDDEQ